MWNNQKAKIICFAAWSVSLSHTGDCRWSLWFVSDALICHVVFKPAENKKEGCVRNGRLEICRCRFRRSQTVYDLQSESLCCCCCGILPVVFVRGWCKQGWSLSMVSNQSARSDLWPLTPTSYFPSLSSCSLGIFYFLFFFTTKRWLCVKIPGHQRCSFSFL